MIKILLSIIFFLILSLSAFGADYYIDCGGAGTDSGTFANPWLDVTNLDGQNLTDGDDVYFKQGSTCTFAGDIDIIFSGVDGANRSILGCYEAEGDFDCSGTRPIVQSSTGNGGAGFSIGDSEDYLTFEYLDIRNTSADWEDCLPGGDGTNNGITTTGTYAGAGHITVDNCKFYHIGHYAIAIANNASNIIITNNTFDTVGNAVYLIQETASNDGSEYVYVANNTFTNIVGYAPCATGVKSDGHAVGFQGVSYAIVENNTSTDAHTSTYISWAVTNGDTHHTIFRDNNSYGSYGAAYYLTGGDDPTSIRNLVYKNVFTSTGEGQDREAIRINSTPNDSDGNRVFNNTIYNAQKQGFGVKDTTYYTYWKNNIVHTNDTTEKLFRTQHSPSNLVIDYNLYWTSSGDPSSTTLWMDANLGAYNWANWTSRNNDENAPSPANPSFTDAANNDFTLQTGSPAIDTGGYLTNVTGVSTTTITVTDPHWFHGNFGLVDADGTAVGGMEITFYDETNGAQQRTITGTSVNYGASTFTVNSTINHIYNAGQDLTDPQYNTQVALTFYSTAPDIGAKEYNMFISDMSPPDNGTDAAIGAAISWTNPTGMNMVDVYFEKISGACDLLIGDRVLTGGTQATYDPAGDMDVSSDYCWRVDILHDGGTETGTVYSFTTASGPPTDPNKKASIGYDSGGGTIKYDSGGMTIQ